MTLPLVLIIFAVAAFADGPGRIDSKFSKDDSELTADPASRQWKPVKGVFAVNNTRGQPTPGHRTEIRSRWTKQNLYFLFVCPYEELNLKPNPTTAAETNKLWEWDVAEVFVGADFDKIWHYREYQVSPQGEWVDLDIDRKEPKPEGGWRWDSGFEVKARLDRERKIWYGEMRIPIRSIDSRPAAAGNEMRINFFRLQGPGPQRKGVAWQPTQYPSHHVPEAFGRLKLVE